MRNGMASASVPSGRAMPPNCPSGIPGMRPRQYLDQMKRVQELLGDIQDAVMAERHLRRFASKREERPSALIAGQMIERARERQRDAKQAFGPVWKKVKKCGKRVWG